VSTSPAPGRPKAGEVPSGDRPRYTADEGLASNPAPGRPKAGEVPLGDRPTYSAAEGRT
jgi:hypothetical protein